MQSKIEQQVMASVGVIYMARQLISTTALKLYVCAISLVALWQLVWVHKVFANLEAVGLSGAAQFFTSAFIHAALAVQISLGVLIVALASLALELIPRSQIRYQ